MGGGSGAIGTASWSQTVSGFTVGTHYDLFFDIAAEYVTPQTVVAQVSGIGITAAPFVALPASSYYWRNWQTEDLSFVADSATETISFTSTTQYDVGLDDVSIASSGAVPEPRFYGVLLTIGLALGFMLRSRWAKFRIARSQ